MPTATYQWLIDWNGDGDFADTGEDVSTRVRGMVATTVVRGRDQIRVLAPPAAGVIRWVLDNQSGDYSYENVSSPLYGNILPRRPMRLKATYAASTYTLGSGITDDLTQALEKEQQSVTASGLGVLSQLAGKTVSTQLYSSIRTDQAIGYLLDAIGWPAADRVLATGNTTLDWWWLDNEDAFQALKALLNSEGPGASTYEDTLSRLVFENRQYRLTTARCTTSQATFRTSGTEPLIQKPITYDPGLQNIVNIVTVTQKIRSAKTASAVWSTTQTITLAPNEVRTVIARGSDIFTSARTPTVGTGDITASAGSLASTSLDRTSGASCTITLTAGAAGVTITAMQLWAQLVTVDSTTNVTNTVDTSASQTKYGQKPYSLATRAEISLNTLQDFCNAIVGLYSLPRPFMTITVNNGDATRLTQILSRTLSDRITVIDSLSGFNGDVFIERLEHSVSATGAQHLLSIGCEKASNTVYGTWDAGLWDSAVWGF